MQKANTAYATVVKTIMGTFAGLLVAVLVLGSTPASATTIYECKTLIDIVRTTLVGAEIGGGNPDRTRASLDSKLDGADIKLDEGKFDDALQKLTQFRDKVEDLRDARKPKISAEDAADLIGAVNDAIACVEALLGYGG